MRTPTTPKLNTQLSVAGVGPCCSYSVHATLQTDDLGLLLVLVKDFEDKHMVVARPDPNDAIKFKMEEKRLRANDRDPLSE